MMSSLPEQTTPQSVAGDLPVIQPMPQPTSRGRLFFLDHLRAQLSILVVLFHLAAIYGANGAFYYVDPPGPQDKLASLVLLVFILVNQAYFMGCFFLISGYFTPGSFDRKGPGIFYKDRLVRLGIPLIVFVFLLSPIASLGFYQTPAGFHHLRPPFTWQQLPSLLGVGPLWFAEMLLFFCLGYVLWRRVRRTLALSGGAAFLGYGTFQSAVYALWDSTFSVGICLALITFFRRFLNRQTRFSRFLSQQAFTVYIIHIPIIVGLSLAIRGIHLESLLKFPLAAALGVPLCFALAFLVRTIPFASRIL
jgi:peptidoglycan/LPS O-acetylase OafA/YrhL